MAAAGRWEEEGVGVGQGGGRLGEGGYAALCGYGGKKTFGQRERKKAQHALNAQKHQFCPAHPPCLSASEETQQLSPVNQFWGSLADAVGWPSTVVRGPNCRSLPKDLQFGATQGCFKDVKLNSLQIKAQGGFFCIQIPL